MTYTELRAQYPYLSDAPDSAIEAYRQSEIARVAALDTMCDGTFSFHVEVFDQWYYDNCTRTDGRPNEGYVALYSIGSARYDDACARADRLGDARVRAMPSRVIVYQSASCQPDHLYSWERNHPLA